MILVLVLVLWLPVFLQLRADTWPVMWYWEKKPEKLLRKTLSRARPEKLAMQTVCCGSGKGQGLAPFSSQMRSSFYAIK
jgi:hypothetical protein